MTWPPQYLSVSSVQLYAECPARWAARYRDGLVLPTTQPMAWGSAFHKALEAGHRGADEQMAWFAAWNAAAAIFTAQGQQLRPGKAHGIVLLDMYRQRGMFDVESRPEQRFRLTLPTPKIPVPVLGFIDLPMPERRRFREFKTTSTNAWNDTKIALEHQLHVYGWAYQRLYRHRPEAAEYVIFNTVSSRVDVYEAMPSPDGLRLFELAAEATWHGAMRGRFDGCGECWMCKPDDAVATAAPLFPWNEEAS